MSKRQKVQTSKPGSSKAPKRHRRPRCPALSRIRTVALLNTTVADKEVKEHLPRTHPNKSTGKRSGGTIKITQLPSCISVIYVGIPRGAIGHLFPRTTRCSSLRSAKAAVTRFRNKYGEPDAFDIEQELSEKLNMPLI